MDDHALIFAPRHRRGTFEGSRTCRDLQRGMPGTGTRPPQQRQERGGQEAGQPRTDPAVKGWMQDAAGDHAGGGPNRWPSEAGRDRREQRRRGNLPSSWVGQGCRGTANDEEIVASNHAALLFNDNKFPKR
jgi:hypothetical protein